MFEGEEEEEGLVVRPGSLETVEEICSVTVEVFGGEGRSLDTQSCE